MDINSTETVTIYTYKIFVLVRVSYDIGMSLLTHVNRIITDIVYIVSSF
jgi:hypothetical protein